MIDEDGFVNGVANEPCRKMVVEQILDVYNNINGQTGAMSGLN